MEITYTDLLHKLQKVALFRELDIKFLSKFVSSADLRIFKKNELICAEGDYEDTCCAILSGSVSIWVKNKNGEKVQVACLGAGETFGEIAALSGNPRIATIISDEFSEILCIDKKALFALMDYSEEVRAFINKRYRERLLKTQLKKIKIFDGLSNKFFEELISSVDLITYQLGETVVSYGEESSDFFLIIFGFAKVWIPRSNGRKGQTNDMSQPQLPSELQKRAANFKIAAYLSPGQYFGEIGLIEKRKRTATVLALTRLELVKIDQAKFHAILSKYCDVKKLLEKVVANRKRKNIEHAEDPSFERFMDWIVTSNIIESDSVLFVDLKKCIKCETCIDTCGKLFGSSRLFMNGLKFNNLLIPASCRHCHEPHCLVGCPTGAISRDFSGEVYHEDFCIGCGNCARNCPFGNIIIVNRNEKRYLHRLGPIKKLFTKASLKNKKRGISLKVYDRNEGDNQKSLSNKILNRKPSVKIATKCDSCKDYPHMGCVRNCPRGAAKRVNPMEYFEELNPL